MKKITFKLIPTSSDFQILDIRLNSNITVNDLKKTTLPNIDVNKSLILNGRVPLWMSNYLMFHYSRNNSGIDWIAQFDPRPEMGGIITWAKDKRNILKIIPGEKIIPFIEIDKHLNKIIAVVGPPHSGKSVFLYVLFKELLKQNFRYFNANAFIIKAAPDGEGLWTSDITPNMFSILRYKNKFTNNFASGVIREIKAISKLKTLVFLDCGGKIDSVNDRILKYASHLIIVSNDTFKTGKWIERYSNDKTKLYAVITSTLDKKIRNKLNDIKDGCFNITMTGLERGSQQVHFPPIFINSFLPK